MVIDDNWRNCFLLSDGESNPGLPPNPGLPRDRRDTYHYTTEDNNFENGQYVVALKG